MREQTEGDKRRAQMKAPAPMQIGGTDFFPKGRHANGDQAWCAIGDPKNPPRYYHASSPHPTDSTKRLFWIFVYRVGKSSIKYIIPGVLLALGLMEVAQSFVTAMERVPLW